MNNAYGCDDVQPLLAELAAGALTGHERAAALRHVTGCAACRSELSGLARAVDGLLLLAPETEPPGGFESSVMARLGADTSDPTTSRLWAARPRRVLAGAAAALVTAAALGAAAVWQHTAPDREIASHTRQTLEVANGRYWQSARLTTRDARAGTVFLYQGKPSWVLVSVTVTPTDGPYRVSIVGRDGAATPIGTCEVDGGSCTGGYEIDIPVKSISAVELNGPDGTRLIART